MNDNIQNLITTIFAIEDNGTQIKLKDENKKSLGAFFKSKKDGLPTQAFQQYQDMEIKSGSTVEISFKEVPYKDGYIKNIIGFREAAGRPVKAPVTPKSAPQATIPPKTEYVPTETKDEKFWDKKAYKQCLWNYWLEKQTGNMDIDWKEEVWSIFNEIEADANKRFSSRVTQSDEIPLPEIPF